MQDIKEKHLDPKHGDEIKRMVKRLKDEGSFRDTTGFIQHGTISVYEHCIRVAYTSCRLAERMRVKVNWEMLIRGALLHDYFLYDWHVKHEGHNLHGFRHPGFALRNARRDFNLSPQEEDIISKHMFPLTVIPPKCREAWIVCLADKICAFEETTDQLKLPKIPFLQRKSDRKAGEKKEQE